MNIHNLAATTFGAIHKVRTLIWLLDKFRNISRFFGQIGTFALFQKNELVWRDDGRWKAKFNLSNKTKDWIFIIRKSRVKWRTWGQNITIRFQWHGMDKKITHGFLTKDKNFNKSSETSQINLIFQHGVLYSSVAS